MVLPSKKNSQGVIRQGDVLIIPLNNSQLKGRKLPHLTLAKGEVTGHAHRISQGKAELYERNGTLFLRILSNTAKLQHKEHHALNIPKGEWMIRIQREYQPMPKIDNQLTDSLSFNKSSITPQSLSSTENHTQSSPQSSLEKPNNVEDEANSVEDEANNVKDDMILLANQINSGYWDSMVKEAEKSREYLGRLQPPQPNLDQDNI